MIREVLTQARAVLRMRRGARRQGERQEHRHFGRARRRHWEPDGHGLGFPGLGLFRKVHGVEQHALRPAQRPDSHETSLANPVVNRPSRYAENLRRVVEGHAPSEPRLRKGHRRRHLVLCVLRHRHVSSTGCGLYKRNDNASTAWLWTVSRQVLKCLWYSDLLHIPRRVSGGDFGNSRLRNWPAFPAGVSADARFACKFIGNLSCTNNFDRPIDWPVGQLLTRHSRSIRLFVAALLLAVSGCRATPTSNNGSTVRGCLASVRTEPP